MIKRIITFGGIVIVLLGLGVYFSEPSHAPSSLGNQAFFDNLTQRLPAEENLPEPFRKAQEYTQSSKRESLQAQTIINLTNDERGKEGKPALQKNKLLTKAAEDKLADMFKLQYFEHESPEGKGPADVIQAAGYGYILVGENLAEGDFKTNAELVIGWMNSPGHRANIMHPKYTEIGVAVRKGTYKGQSVWMAVQEFGKPLTDCPPVEEGLKSAIAANEAQIQSWQAKLQTMSAKMAKAQANGDVDTYNAMVAPYNELVNQVNILISQTKEIVARYNSQVQKFNACIA